MKIISDEMRCAFTAIHDVGHKRSPSAVRPHRAHARVRLRWPDGARRRPPTPVLRQTAAVLSDVWRRCSRAISQHQSIVNSHYSHWAPCLSLYRRSAWFMSVVFYVGLLPTWAPACRAGPTCPFLENGTFGFAQKEPKSLLSDTFHRLKIGACVCSRSSSLDPGELAALPRS